MNKKKKEDKIKMSNDVKDLRSLKQLYRLSLDYESPRLQKACQNLGITVEELKMKDKEQFEDKHVSRDVVDLRYKVRFSSILFNYIVICNYVFTQGYSTSNHALSIL